MTLDDPEFQRPSPPTRKFGSRVRRLTGMSLNDSEQPNLRQQQDEEIQICQHLISLLVDNQPMTPSLNTACEWYRQYLKNNIINYWPLIESALEGVKRSSKCPSREDFAIAISFVHGVARQLVTEEKDVALCDIVDELVNAKNFKPELDEDRIIPNQLVFTVIGWLLLLFEVPLEQHRDKLQIKATYTSLASSMGYLNPRNFREHSQGFDYFDIPLHQLLSEFGDIIPEVKPEVARRPSYVPPSENIYLQLVCYGTAWLIARLEIEWVDTLSQHLELDVSRRTLKLFRFPSYCRMMHHQRNIHRRLLTDHAMSLLESEKEPVVPADSLFRELLLTYRVLFGQDERSFRAFQRSCSRKDTKYASDPLLPVLCDRSWTMPDAHDLYRDINAGAVRDTYDLNADFPIMGPKLLALQQFVKGYHPRTLTALLRDRRDPTAWYNVWTTQTLVLFACLAILIAVLQLVFQIWQVVLAKQQLAQNYPPVVG